MSATRRNLLAMGAAVVACRSTPAASASAPALAALIEAHRALYAEFERVCLFEDNLRPEEPGYAEAEARCASLSEREDALMDELLAFPVKSLKDARTKALYVATHFERGQPQHYHFDAFLRSLI